METQFKVSIYTAQPRILSNGKEILHMDREMFVDGLRASREEALVFDGESYCFYGIYD